MRGTDQFQLALGLNSPWQVAAAKFDAAKRLDIEIDFECSGRFRCPACAKADCPAYGTETMTWRHLDFFQHQAYLNARVPRIRCPGCGVRQATVPLARPGSGFTLLFEALAIALVTHMPAAAAARLTGEHDTRLWRMVMHYTDDAVTRQNLSDVTRVRIDETAAKRGHDYISLFVDIDRRRVVFIADGRESGTVHQFKEHLSTHQGDAANIKQVCIDMSGAFIKSVGEALPQAQITFDKFHAVKLVNDAVDKVRRAESKARPELKNTRYLWLKNEANLASAGRIQPDSLARAHLKTGRAYGLRVAFQTLYRQPIRDWAEDHPDR
jgi:transposase